MAFSIFFKIVENDEDFPSKASPWRCDKCHEAETVLLKFSIDYDTMVLCKKCLMGAKRLITDREKELKKELKDGKDISDN